MSDKKLSVASGGIGLCGMLFILFLGLKLAEVGQVATWSWWWVFAPLWGPAVLVLAIFVVILLVAFIVAFFTSWGAHRRARAVERNMRKLRERRSRAIESNLPKPHKKK